VNGPADGAVFVYVTAGDREAALSLGRALVEARLAACANVIPRMRSVYRWRGAIEEGEEAVLILKTRRALVEALTDKVRALHDYDCPCVVALPVIGGNPAFLDWIAAETEREA
jgi:periplasmic divalent cation tolerance protein